MKDIKVKGHSHLKRTPNNAIVNHDTSEYNKYLKNKQKIEKQVEEFDNMKKEIEYLKNIINELIDK